MFTLLILLSQLPVAAIAIPLCTRGPEEPGHAGEEVFTSKEEASSFIHRHLLYNRFDLELFTPGDLERECVEELCNYEEAREIFVDEDKTLAFWQDYSIKGPTAKSVLQPPT
ncbi:transmembrane gamma-carboxyglutamic acid protein 4 isoform X2 [Pipistrellus kuhlii]|uniref:transmembrane gamma-carboxyglutamic acid protein 4 isoform X2 n=1 Tax=Pipistrellus kuhlii TaxID=59472 RepID=UPI00174F0B22|nr:transmembrane gamma-carboxyglutamic acid protein 4 isoform X2 [Pipistrellus kuhlii]